MYIFGDATRTFFFRTHSLEWKLVDGIREGSANSSKMY